MSTPNQPLIERIGLDIIAAKGKAEYRVWTDATHLRWSGPRGLGGFVPLELFRLAALHMAQRCEAEAMTDDGDQADLFIQAVVDNVTTPIELAAGDPFWRDPDDVRGDVRLGFDSLAVVTSIDGEARGLLKEHEPPPAEGEVAP